MSQAQAISEKQSHPPGLWLIASISAVSSFGFALINSLLILFSTSLLHISDSKAYEIFATYNSLLFTLPFIGGFLAEQLGYKRAFLFGLVLYTLGLVFISTMHVHLVILGLATFTTGVAFFVPTYLVLQGKLYAKADKRRESAFTISYIIMNIGFFIAGIMGGYLARYFNYRITFLIGAIVVASCFVIYLFGKKYIVPYGDRVIAPKLQWPRIQTWSALVLSGFIIIFISRWLLSHTSANNEILFTLIALSTIAIVYNAFKRKDKLARSKLIAFVILSYISVGFWALYTLEPSLLTIFIRNNVDRHIFGSVIPPSAFYSLDSFFVIILGGIFSYLWIYLNRINRNPTLPTKFTLSLFSMAIGFFVLIAGIYMADERGLTSMLAIFIAYFFLSTGELLIGPIGQSMVGRLSPEGMEGRLMGVWQLFTGFAGALSGYLAQFAVVPKHISVTASNPVYVSAFAKIGGMTLCLAIIALFLIPHIKKLISK